MTDAPDEAAEAPETPAGGAATIKIHHAELFTKRCVMRATLNGIPIAHVVATDEHTDHFAPPINPFLIGEGNVLEVSIEPAPLPDGEVTGWDEARVEMAVRVFDKGGIVMPGAGGPAITEADFTPELAARIAEAEEADEELEVPQTFLHVFDNDYVSFAAEIMDVEPFEDEDALIDYALHIRDLFANGDVNGFLAEIEPKCQVWAAAYDEPAQRFRDDIAGGLTNEFLPAGPITDFGRDDVELEPIAGGRMWTLMRRGGLPLIQTTPNADDQFMQFPIVVAERDGQLRIVR